MGQFERAMALLERDRVRNSNVIHFMKDYPIHFISIAGDSVMIKGRSDRDWVYISSEDEGEFRVLTGELIGQDTCFAIIEDWMLPHLIAGRRELWRLSCLKLYLPENAPALEPDGPVIELDLADAPFIYTHYDYAAYTTEAFIVERIEKGPGFGIRENGKLVAWIMTQDDGAMGFLTVLPEYRRHGYGARITNALIRRLRETGLLPFVHIEEKNEKSMGLALKSGFVADRRIHWFELSSDRNPQAQSNNWAGLV